MQDESGSAISGKCGNIGASILSIGFGGLYAGMCIFMNPTGWYRSNIMYGTVSGSRSRLPISTKTACYDPWGFMPCFYCSM